jgi:hypothetical protein
VSTLICYLFILIVLINFILLLVYDLSDRINSDWSGENCKTREEELFELALCLTGPAFLFIVAYLVRSENTTVNIDTHGDVNA